MVSSIHQETNGVMQSAKLYVCVYVSSCIIQSDISLERSAIKRPCSMVITLISVIVFLRAVVHYVNSFVRK